LLLVALSLGGCATAPEPPARVSSNEVRIVAITPSGDGLLATGERVQVGVEYRLDSTEGAFLLIRPYQDGLPAQGYRAHVGIPVYRGEGHERGWIEFDTVADINEIRATLAHQQTLSVIASASRSVELRWREPNAPDR
jgi:hypothetical protein